MSTIDIDALYQAHRIVKQTLASSLQDLWLAHYHANHHVGAGTDSQSIAQRSFKNLCLDYLMALETDEVRSMCIQQFETARNMTDQIAALAELSHLDTSLNVSYFDAFYQQWKNEDLVIDKWFGIQIGQAAPADASKVARLLTKHEAFNVKNPNRFRATLGALAANTAGFHAANGSGYALLTDWLITLDGINPQTTARMTSAFETWAMWDSARGEKMRVEMKRILSTPNLSSDTTEMITRILA